MEKLPFTKEAYEPRIKRFRHLQKAISEIHMPANHGTIGFGEVVDDFICIGEDTELAIKNIPETGDYVYLDILKWNTEGSEETGRTIKLGLESLGLSDFDTLLGFLTKMLIIEEIKHKL